MLEEPLGLSIIVPELIRHRPVGYVVGPWIDNPDRDVDFCACKLVNSQISMSRQPAGLDSGGTKRRIGGKEHHVALGAVKIGKRNVLTGAGMDGYGCVGVNHRL